MKICVISNLYPPGARGGAERVAKIIADKLFTTGNEVSVVSTKAVRGLTKETVDGVIVYRFKPMNLFYYLDDFRYSACWRFFWRLIDTFNIHSAYIIWKILKKDQPQVVITHNLVGIGLLVPFVIKILKIKHCHILHDVQLAVPSGVIISGEETYALIQRWMFCVYARICKILFSSPQIVISPSKWLMEYYVSKCFFKKSSKTILINPLKSIISELPIKNQKSNKFLFVGQIAQHKGIDWLIDVWHKNQIKDELIIVGETERKSTLKNILFVGKKEDEALNKFFVQVDFLIVPSICYENSPTVIPLSYSNATPVIVSDAGGIAELVKEGETGFIFKTKDEADFLRIYQLLKNLSADELERLSQNCREAAKSFSLDTYTDKLVELLK